MESLIDNSVNLGGEQNITGDKTLKNDISSLMPPAEKSTKNIYFKDVNGVMNGGVQTSIDTSLVESVFYASNIISGTRQDSALRCVVTNTGDKYIKGVASDVNGSVVTTVAKKQALSGYYKLGNKLIVQWGFVSSFGTDTVVTLPIPYANEDAWAASITILSGTNFGYPTYFKSRTATNFTGRRNDSNKPAALWVAIGYGA